MSKKILYCWLHQIVIATLTHFVLSLCSKSIDFLCWVGLQNELQNVFELKNV